MAIGVRSRAALALLSLVLLLHSLPRAAGISCYTDVSLSKSPQDCSMHNLCLKEFVVPGPRARPSGGAVTKRGCFLGDAAANDTCVVVAATGRGVCYCNTDLCNDSPSSAFNVLLLSLPLLIYAVVK